MRIYLFITNYEEISLPFPRKILLVMTQMPFVQTCRMVKIYFKAKETFFQIAYAFTSMFIYKVEDLVIRL